MFHFKEFGELSFVSCPFLVRGPYYKIRTTQGTNQNAPFHHRPVHLLIINMNIGNLKRFGLGTCIIL